MRTKFLTSKGARKSALNQTQAALGGGKSSGWSRIDYGVRAKNKKVGPLTLHYYETFVRTSERDREYYSGS